MQNPVHVGCGEVIDWRLNGQVVTGLGEGAGFTQLDWAREKFLAMLGIDPFPGTLNLRLEEPPELTAWRTVQAKPGIRIAAPDSTACDARAYPVLIRDVVPAAVLVPEVPAYPDDQVELIAAVPLRETLNLRDGDSVLIHGLGRPRIAAAIFDVDGTLLDSMNGYLIASARAAAAYGYEVTMEALQQALNYHQPFWELVIPDGEPRDAETVARLRRDTMRHWPEVLAEHVTPFPGVRDTLATLRDAGVRLAICTGSVGESFPPLVSAGLLDWFEVVITAQDVTERKPHPEGVLRCVEQLGVSAEAAVYVGDTAPDMAAGRAAGVFTLGVLSGAGDSATLSSAGAHRIVPDHSSLTALFDLEPS